MKTPKILPVSLLIAAGLFAAPGSFADEFKTIQAKFAYNTADKAEVIYSDLKRTARDACRHDGVRTLAMQKIEWNCVKQMVDDGVARIGRADIAVLHNGNYATADTRG